MEFSFETIEFKEFENKVRIYLLKLFYHDVDKEELNSIANFEIKNNKLIFHSEEARVERKFYNLIEHSLKNLTNSITGNPTTYIDQYSGIPLIGSNAFGIVDRNTTLIEIKPITSCNYNCIYCSVNEGINGNKLQDFIIEKDYLVEETKKLVEFKDTEDIELHIGPQGEPLLYADLVELIRDFSKIPNVSTISMDTNGSLLTEQKIDELKEAGLTRINLSLNTLNSEKYRKIAGNCGNLTHIKKILNYAKNKIQILIAPVWVPTINDKDMNDLIELAKEMNCMIGIQKFLRYKSGRNPVKEITWDKFYDILKKQEEEFDYHLILDPEKDFNIRFTKKLPKPFKKNQTIRAKIIGPGRMRHETLAVAENRIITIANSKKKSGQIKVKINRDKHNVFYGA